MGNTNELILIHRNMKKVSRVNDVNVMLTPQFYTLKREHLPIKYAYQAKKIAASLFDGLLEENRTYSYFVSKEDESWLFIAYDVEKITAFLESKGIEVQHVSKIFFAQQSASLFTSPVLLGKNEALVNLEGTVVVVPQIALDNTQSALTVVNSFTPKKGVSLEGGKSFLSQKQALSFAVIFLLFAGIFFTEGIRSGDDSQEEEKEIQMLLEEHPSLQSSYARDSIAKKYGVIDKAERKKRDIIKVLSTMIFKGATLTSLSIDDKKFQAQFSCTDINIVNKLQELAKKEKFNTAKIAQSNDLRIEGML